MILSAVLSFVAPWSVYLPSVGGSTGTTLIHVICHVLAMVCMIVGVVAIVNVKAVNSTPSGNGTVSLVIVICM